MGVILVVAITVILAAVIATVVVELGQSATGSSGQSDVGVQTSIDGSQVVVEVVTGETDELQLKINGTQQDSDTNVGSGDTLSAPADKDSTISFSSIDDGETVLVSTSNPFAQRGGRTVLNPQSAPTSGLIAHYPLDGSVTDETGTYAGSGNSLTYTSTDAGTAAVFDGTSGHARLDTFPLDNSFTLSVWVTADSFTHESNPRIFNSAPSDNNGVRLFFTDTGAIRFGNVAAGDELTTDTTLSTGQRYLVTAVMDEGQMRVYINGTRDTATLPSSSVNENSALYAGVKASEGNDWHDGQMRDIRVYDRALSDQEAQDLYDATK